MGHPHTTPARQLRRAIEPRLTYRMKRQGKKTKERLEKNYERDKRQLRSQLNWLKTN